MQIWPLLFVRDIRRSASFYREQLGFAMAGRAGADDDFFWCRLERDGSSIMLQQADDPASMRDAPAPTVVIYVVCDDVDALHAELTGRGLPLDPPEDAYYGMRQLHVPEPDGYTLVFETRTPAWSG